MIHPETEGVVVELPARSWIPGKEPDLVELHAILLAIVRQVRLRLEGHGMPGDAAPRRSYYM
jgi:hypothetical protein